MPRRNAAGSRPAAKAELRATKAELKMDFRRLAAVQMRMEDDLRSIRREMATKEDVSRVLSAIDAFARKAEIYDRKTLSHPGILQDHEARLQDHERRIGRLESR